MLIHWTPTLYNQKKPPHSPWPPRQNSDGMQLWHLWRRSVAQTYATRRSVRFAKAHEKSLVGGDWIPYMSSSHHQYEFYMGLGLSHKIYEFYDFHFIYGMSSQPHWRTPSFFRGVGQPPTSWYGCLWNWGKVHSPIVAIMGDDDDQPLDLGLVFPFKAVFLSSLHHRTKTSLKVNIVNSEC